MMVKVILELSIELLTDGGTEFISSSTVPASPRTGEGRELSSEQKEIFFRLETSVRKKNASC